MKKNLTIYLFLLLTTINFAQETKSLTLKNKGKLYFYWGWNGSSYTKSDISFKGTDYNFTLGKVKANDRQTKFSLNKYLNPANMTIPQYNFRIGYYFKDNLDISFGIDHMKYVVQQGSTAKINGTISNSNTIYDGIYNNDDIIIEENFLKFEHTDGLNYVNIELRHSNKLLDFKKTSLNFNKGLGIGILYPKTNATLLNNERYDNFNFAGYGINAIVGLNITFFKHFFIQSEIKGGFINMPNIRTTLSTNDSAKQNFFFFQRNIVFGGILNLTNYSKNKKQ